MKVKHPGINKSVHSFGRSMKILLFVCSPFISFGHFVKQFTNAIYVQLDYNNEVKNTQLLKTKLQHEPKFIVPTIYTHSENFIFMSYHQGVPFDIYSGDTIRVSIYMIFLTLSFLLVYDLFHGDLHYGNWKVQNTGTNDFKIILYDCGMLYSTNNIQFNKNVLMYLTYNDYYNVLRCCGTQDPEKIHKVLQFIETKYSDVPVAKRVKYVITESVKNGLVKDNRFIHILQSYSVVMDTLFVAVDKMNRFFNKQNDIAITFYMYIELLERLQIFSELKEFLKEWMDSEPQYKIVFDEWKMENFGHNDVSIIADIIYSKLF